MIIELKNKELNKMNALENTNIRRIKEIIIIICDILITTRGGLFWIF